MSDQVCVSCVPVNGVPMMGSKAIVSVLNGLKTDGEKGVEHYHILRDIDKMLNDLQTPKMDSGVFVKLFESGPNIGKTEEIFLNEDLSICFVSGKDAKVRMAVVKGFQAGRAMQQTTLPNFLDPAEAAIAWATEYKAKQLALADNARLTESLQEVTTDFRDFRSVTRLSAVELAEVEQLLGDVYAQSLIMHQRIPASQRFELPSRAAGRHKSRMQAAIKVLCGLDDKKHTYKDAQSLKMPAIKEILNAELSKIQACLKT